MIIVDVLFNSICDNNNSTNPYVTEEGTIKLECDGKEGSIYFNGYYRVENHPPPYPEDDLLEHWNRPYRRSVYLPRKHQMIIDYGIKTPCNEECFIRNKCLHSEYTKNGKCDVYNIEIYKKDTHENTNEISRVEDCGGQEIDVCFFPTDFLTLHFKVLEYVKDFKPCVKGVISGSLETI